MIMQTNTLDDFSNTSGTEDFQQQKVPPSQIFNNKSAVLRGSNWEIPLPPFGQGWFDNVYMDGDIRVAKDIRGDYLVVDRAPFNWKE
ncbi:hypothetical protein DY000_02004795 [Brassica cretica]|uniref:Plastid lipid-associated protein/fibrillin conserved domain-containing protein n=1 Tax=Brassica cretica TaxID=69181 RepID=A0ABQ7CLH2_BRACR|nr:hypothetical protein DY000_02004795 [Brassica cretica]